MSERHWPFYSVFLGLICHKPRDEMLGVKQSYIENVNRVQFNYSARYMHGKGNEQVFNC